MDCRLPDDVSETVARALAEDIGSGDLTAALVPADAPASAAVVCREDMVLCGTAWFDETFRQLDAGTLVEWHAQDGDALAAGASLCGVNGPARALLTGERTALNFLQVLSGTATTAARWAAMVAGTRTRVLDTRKTLPGLRSAQKYAVCCGGCDNHRMGLWDGVLVKENHIAALGGITNAVRDAQRRSYGVLIEVEVENLDELEEAIAAGCDIALLDNFDRDLLVEAVRLNNGRVRLEASGNVTLDRVAGIAATGVDFISTGALTKDVRMVDLSMRFDV